jgi:hypothetical protein
MTYFREDVPALGRRDVGSGGRTKRSDVVMDGLRACRRMATRTYERLHRLVLPREWSLGLEDAQTRRLERIAGSIGPWLTALISIVASLVLAFRK